MPRGIHYGATAETKWTNMSLTSKEMFSFCSYSIQTVVYLGKKLLRGSHESLDAAIPFLRTLESLPPGVPGSGLSARILLAVKSSSSPSSPESASSAVNSKVTGRPLGSGARGRSLVWLRSRIFAHLGCRVVHLSHHSVRIPGHFAMVQPWESA